MKVSLNAGWLGAVLFLSSCQTPEPPTYPVETEFQVTSNAPGAHVIVAAPPGYAALYLGTTPVSYRWELILLEEEKIPAAFEVIAIQQGYLPERQRLAFVNFQPTAAHIQMKRGLPTVLEREDLRLFSIGLSVDDMKTIWGPPESTSSTRDGLTLYYSGISRDPVSEMIDRMIEVVVHDGLVAEVNFY